MPRDRHEGDGAANRGDRDRADGHGVDRDLFGFDAGDDGDVPVALEGLQQHWIGQSGNHVERELIAVSVERRGSSEVREAGSKDRGATQRDHPEHSAEERSTQRHYASAGAPLQRVAYADEHARRSTDRR